MIPLAGDRSRKGPKKKGPWQASAMVETRALAEGSARGEIGVVARGQKESCRHNCSGGGGAKCVDRAGVEWDRRRGVCPSKMKFISLLSESDRSEILSHITKCHVGASANADTTTNSLSLSLSPSLPIGWAILI